MTHLPHWIKKIMILIGKASVYTGGITFACGAIFSVWQFGWTEYK